MTLLANAAEDNEAYENLLTHAQLQQLQQHLLQQQFQVTVASCMSQLGVHFNNLSSLSMTYQPLNQ